jgi:hypothetical protein
MRKSVIHFSESRACPNCFAVFIFSSYSRIAQDNIVAVKAIGNPNFIRSPASYIPFDKSKFISIPSSSPESPLHPILLFTNFPAATINQ